MFRIYWVGQKVPPGFSVTSYRKTWANILANPIIGCEVVEQLISKQEIGFNIFLKIKNIFRLEIRTYNIGV